MIREPYNLNPYNSTIDTSKVNNFSFTFSGDELGSWNIEIAKNNTSPEIVYTSEEFVPEDMGYSHIYDGDIVEGITLPSTIAHSQGDDGLLRRLYSINGYPFNEAVVKLNVNGIENIGNIKGSTTNGYLVATNYSLGRAENGVTIIGFDKDGTTIGSQVTDGTYDFLGYLLSVKTNSNIQVGQVVQIEGNSFIIGNIEDVGDGYSELTIVNGEATFSDTASIASFDSLAEADVTELTVGIEPVQDLNGYDKPWVGGAGKNKMPTTATTQTVSGVNITIKDDGSFHASGTATADIYLNLGDASASANTWIASCGVIGSWSTYGIYIRNVTDNVTINMINVQNYTFTLTDTKTIRFILCIKSGQAMNTDFYPMLRLATETDPTWQPYSNICPITGHDEVTVTDEGKNRLDNTVNSGQTLTSNGVSCTINSDGSVTVSGTATGGTINAWFVGNYGIVFKVKRFAAGTYTFTDFLPFYHYVDETILRSVKVTFASRSTTFTFTKDWWLDGVRCPAAETGTEYNLTLYPQMELGATATSFEPYRSNTYTTSLGQTVYGGTLDLVSGVLTVDKGFYTVTDVSEIIGTGSKVGTYPKWLLAINSLPNVDPSYYGQFWDRQDAVICNMGIMVRESVSLNTNETTMSVYFHANSVEIRLRPLESDFPTLEEAKQAYVGAEFVYPVIPTTYQLTAQQIKTLVGTNNVWASSGDIVSITFKYNIN